MYHGERSDTLYSPYSRPLYLALPNRASFSGQAEPLPAARCLFVRRPHSHTPSDQPFVVSFFSLVRSAWASCRYYFHHTLLPGQAHPISILPSRLPQTGPAFITRRTYKLLVLSFSSCTLSPRSDEVPLSTHPGPATARALTWSRTTSLCFRWPLRRPRSTRRTSM